MSPKELLYIEDALSQEQQSHKLYNSFASQLQDPQLRSFVQGLANKKQQCYNKFYSLLG